MSHRIQVKYYLPFCILFLMTFTIAWAHLSLKYGINFTPEISGDEFVYLDLGWNVSKGNGYTLHQVSHKNLLSSPGEAPTSDRSVRPTLKWPPLYPTILAVGFKLFGNQYWWGRLWNSFAIAGIIAIVGSVIANRFGMISAVVTCALILLIDVRIFVYSRLIMTEASAALYVGIATLTLAKLYQNRSLYLSIQLGVILGLAILTRPIVLTWLPLILLSLILTKSVSKSGVCMPKKMVLTTVALTALIIITPWCIYNCTISNKFTPLGTAGSIDIWHGYSDSAWAHKGLWYNAESEGYPNDFPYIVSTGFARELELSSVARSYAWKWLPSHIPHAMILFVIKIYQEVRPYYISDPILWLLALAGAYLYRYTYIGRACIVMILSCFVSVGLTWSVRGRFIMPVMFPQYVLASFGFIQIINLISKSKPQIELTESDTTD